MDNTISVEEYREKKAQLLNQKVELERNRTGAWIDRAVSNLKLLDGNLIIAYTSEFKTLAETANEDMGSHYYKPSSNLSLYTGIYYSEFIAFNKKICTFREVIFLVKCPFCPVIFGSKLRNSLRY